MLSWFTWLRRTRGMTMRVTATRIPPSPSTPSSAMALGVLPPASSDNHHIQRQRRHLLFFCVQNARCLRGFLWRRTKQKNSDWLWKILTDDCVSQMWSYELSDKKTKYTIKLGIMPPSLCLFSYWFLIFVYKSRWFYVKIQKQSSFGSIIETIITVMQNSLSSFYERMEGAFGMHLFLFVGKLHILQDFQNVEHSGQLAQVCWTKNSMLRSVTD